MKKLIAVSILLTLLTAGVFAQFSIGVYGDFYPNLLKTTTPTGDFADDTNANYGGAGTFDVFSTDGPFHGNELRLTLGYTDPDKKYGGSLVIKGDAFLNRDSEYFQTDGTVGGGGQSILDFFAQPFDAWSGWGEVGIFKGFVGYNVADRGPAGGARYNDAFVAVFDNFMMYNLGITAPGANIDTFNLAKYPNPTQRVSVAEEDPDNPSTDGNKDGNKSFVSVTANLAPLKVAVAGDLSSITDPANTSYNHVGAAVRVSGEKVADLVSFDAIYRIAGGDPETDDDVIDQPDGRGRWGHSFGLVANATLFDTLGITAGYSGYTLSREKDTAGDSTTYVYPYYNGIDLRFAFTGVDKLVVDFNNNISFSTFKGDNDTNRVYETGLARTYTGWVDASDVSAGYLGLYNGLGVKYSITDSLFAALNLANRLRSTTVTDDSGTETITTTLSNDTFRAYAGAGYSFGSNVLLETGLLFQIDGTNYDVSNNSSSSYNGGAFTFAIPVRFKVAF